MPYVVFLNWFSMSEICCFNSASVTAAQLVMLWIFCSQSSLFAAHSFLARIAKHVYGSHTLHILLYTVPRFTKSYTYTYPMYDQSVVNNSNITYRTLFNCSLRNSTSSSDLIFLSTSDTNFSWSLVASTSFSCNKLELPNI